MGDTRITGKLIMEDRGPLHLTDGRNVVLVFGMMAVPADVAAEYCAERPDQKTVMGDAHAGIMRLGIVDNVNDPPSLPYDEDREDDLDRWRSHLSVMRVDQLITSPIWRV